MPDEPAWRTYDRKHKDDAIAYGWIMILIFLILGSFTYLCVIMLYNGVITQENIDISAGLTSEQTKQATSFNRDMAMYMPVFMLIGAFVWSMVRGIGGSGATYQSFYTGFVIFLLCCIVGFLMSYSGGMLIDRLYMNLDNIGYINNATHMTAEWAAAQNNTIWTFINLYYFICYMVPVMGGAVYFQGIAKRTGGNVYIR